MGTGILFLIVGSIAIVAPEIFLIPLGELLALDARTTVQLSGHVFCFCAVSRAVVWILRRRIAGTACSRSGMVALGTAGPGWPQWPIEETLRRCRFELGMRLPTLWSHSPSG